MPFTIRQCKNCGMPFDAQYGSLEMYCHTCSILEAEKELKKVAHKNTSGFYEFDKSSPTEHTKAIDEADTKGVKYNNREYIPHIASQHSSQRSPQQEQKMKEIAARREEEIQPTNEDWEELEKFAEQYKKTQGENI